MATLDGINITEVLGTAAADTLSATGALTIFYGLAGNDSFTSAAGDIAFFVGGSGNDTYRVGNGALAVIADVNGGNDTAIATGIGATFANSVAATLDNGRHLLLADEDHGVAVAVLNWLDPDWRIENFQGGDGTYSLAEVQALVAQNTIGDFTWEGLTNGVITAAAINQGLSEFASHSQQLESGGGSGGVLQVGTAGADTMAGSTTSDELQLGAGNDSGWGLAGNDLLSGAAGDDRLFGNFGDDTLQGGDGNDQLKGHPGDDVVNGDAGNDLLYGGADDDTMDGGPGSDTVNGNSGFDTVLGGDGNDTIRGQGGRDSLVGGDGDDLLLGMQGFDTLLGGNGNDALIGGLANDTLTGGDGVDIFSFAAGHGTNTITDFEDGTDLVALTGVSGLGGLDIADSPAGAVITYSSGGDGLSITLTGITASQLSAADFAFS